MNKKERNLLRDNFFYLAESDRIKYYLRWSNSHLPHSCNYTHYFAFRGLRYQGPKKAFHYLKIHDPEILPLFDEALSNIDNTDILEKLIKKITK